MKILLKQLFKRSMFFFFCAVGAVGVPQIGVAQEDFPSKPIKFVVPFGPGSSSDITARAYAQVMGELTKQPIIVENKGGGGGIIGARAVLNEPADGYTVFFASNSALSTNAVVMKDLPYDPVVDFDPVSVLELSYAALAVPANSKFQTFSDLVEFAKSNPGVLNHGAGSPTYTLWNEWLIDTVGVQVANIPYKDSGAAALAVGAGEVDYGVVAINPLRPLIKSGHVRVLLFTGPERHPELPDVPTPNEVGLKDYEARIWNAVAVKAGTPQLVRDRLVSLFHQAGESSAIQNRMKAQGHTPFSSGPDLMHEFQINEIKQWRKLMDETGLKFE